MELIWEWDLAIQQAVNRGWSSPALDTFFLIVTYLGVGAVQVLLIAPFTLLRQARPTAVTCLVAYAISGLSVRLMKMIFPRLRPSNWPETIVAPDERIFLSSFPSGHAVTSFAIAFAIAFVWPAPRRWLAGSLALFVALLVGISRIYRGVHWPTDVVGSMALGFLSAVAAVAIVEAILARRRAKEL